MAALVTPSAATQGIWVSFRFASPLHLQQQLLTDRQGWNAFASPLLALRRTQSLNKSHIYSCPVSEQVAAQNMSAALTFLTPDLTTAAATAGVPSAHAASAWDVLRQLETQS